MGKGSRCQKCGKRPDGPPHAKVGRKKTRLCPECAQKRAMKKDAKRAKAAIVMAPLVEEPALVVEESALLVEEPALVAEEPALVADETPTMVLAPAAEEPVTVAEIPAAQEDAAPAVPRRRRSRLAPPLIAVVILGLAGAALVLSGLLS